MHVSNAEIKQEFKENEALLLTLGKLPQFFSEGNNPSQFFHHTIRINAIKTGGQWYEFQKVARDLKNQDRLFDAPEGSWQRLDLYDFEILNVGHLYTEGQEGDGLIFNPNENQLKIAHHGYKYPFVCTHKTEKRIGKIIFQCFSGIVFIWFSLCLGPKCPGVVAECNDKGICFNGKCECLDGYSGNTCTIPPACLNDEWNDDGYCDDYLNTPECNYDGGDCCDGSFQYCAECICYD